MRKYFYLALAPFFLTSCPGPDPVDPEPEPYVTDSLVVNEASNALLFETTGTWCQYCPNGTATMRRIINQYNTDHARIIGFASHTGDALETPLQTALNALFTASGVPNFYVNNDDAGQQVDGPVGVALAAEPVVGAAHVWHENATGDSVIVDIKVQFFDDENLSNYFVQSYLLVSDIEAREYNLGGIPIDLNQTSSVNWMTKGSGNTPTTWAVTDSAVGVTAGDIVTHDHIPFTMGSTENPYGVPLDSINPLGTSFFDGDIFGSKYTPIQIKIDKSALSAIAGIPHSLSVATLIWKPATDGSQTMWYVNGYVDLHH